VFKPIVAGMKTQSTGKIVNIADKGKGALLTFEIFTNEVTEDGKLEPLCANRMGLFIRVDIKINEYYYTIKFFRVLVALDLKETQVSTYPQNQKLLHKNLWLTKQFQIKLLFTDWVEITTHFTLILIWHLWVVSIDQFSTDCVFTV